MIENADKALAAASRTPKAVAPLAGNALAWETFVNAAVSTVPVKHVLGTDRLVGIGMLNLGKSAWKDAVDVDELLTFLVADAGIDKDERLRGLDQQTPERERDAVAMVCRDSLLP